MPKERDRNYDKLRRLYITSEKSLRKIAEEKGVPYGSLAKVSSQEKWVQQRKKYRRDTANKAIAYARAREVETVKTAMRAMDVLVKQAEAMLQAESPFEKTVVSPTGTVVSAGVPDYNAMRAYAAGMKSIVDAFVALYPERDVKEEPEGVGVVEMPARRKPKPPEGEGDG